MENNTKDLRVAILTIISRDKHMSEIAIKEVYNITKMDEVLTLRNKIMKYVNFFEDDHVAQFTDWVMLDLKTTNINGSGCLEKEVSYCYDYEIVSFLTTVI